MLLFAILHNFRIRVLPSSISDMPNATGFAAITQRHAAQCLALLWRDTADDRRDYVGWYWMWNTDWSYDRVDQLAGDELKRFNEIKSLIENHPVVDSVTPEDD